jgi:hypothetical protein
MKISVLDAMRLSFERRISAPFDLAKMSFEVSEPSALRAEDYREYLARVDVNFKQIGPAGLTQQMTTTARRSIARLLFKEVEAEILDILRLQWEGGYHHTPATERLEKMLPVLRGE